MSKSVDANLCSCKCPICGKAFHIKPSRIKKAKEHYCSQKCFYESKRESMKGPKNHQYGLRGKLNSSWEGGRHLSTYGYIVVYSPQHPFARKNDLVFEHRLVAEKYLLTEENSVEINGKRYLAPGYVVHHKNGIKTDNRPENLQIMTLSEHQTFHNKISTLTRKRDNLGRFVKSTANNKEETVK